VPPPSSTGGPSSQRVVSRPDAPLPPSARAYVIDDPPASSRRAYDARASRPSYAPPRPPLPSLRGPDAPPRPSLPSMRGPDAPPPRPPLPSLRGADLPPPRPPLPSLRGADLPPPRPSLSSLASVRGADLPPPRPSLPSLRGPDLPPPPLAPEVKPAAWVTLAMLAVPLGAILAALLWLPSWRPREAPAAPAANATSRPSPAQRLRGRVVDEEGDGVEGAHVVAVPDGPTFAVVQETSTDALGSFALAGVASQTLRLVAEQGDKLVVSAPLAVPASGALEGLVLTLARGRTLRGHVRDEDGAPVAEAAFTVDALPWPGRSAASDPEGAFELARVPADAPALVVTARGFVTARVPLPSRAGDGPETFTITLQRAPELRGSVVDPEGRPVASALVLACDGKDGGRAVTDEAGAFRLPASSEGCQVVAQHDEFAPSEPAVARAERGFVLRLGAGGAIAGVVVDEAGAPVPAFDLGVESFTPATGEHSFSIRSGPSRPFQDPAGAFALDRLAPGSYVLTATTDGKPPARSASVDVTPGRPTAGVRIVMAAGGTVEGRVFDEAKHAPVAGARVAFDALTSTRPDGGPSTATDAEGTFRLENAPAGPFSLRIEHEGYRTRLVSSLRVNARQVLRQEIALAPAEGAGLAFAGIGATLQQTRDGLVFTDAFAGSPAQRAGVRPGDRLRRMDGESVEGFSLADAIQRLRGNGGTAISVTIERDGVPWPLDFVIVRAEIVR
jgi:hypothetical protein